MKILNKITAALTIAAFSQFSFAQVVQNIPVPASSTGGASTASVVVPSLAQITTLATNLSNTAYSNSVNTSTNYTNAAIAGITCPVGQVRQGTTCIVPINATDVATAAENARASAVLTSTNYAASVANTAYTNAVSTANTNATSYTNTAIANITCPAGQVRQGTICVVPINATDVATSSANAVANAVNQANTYTNNYIANITCPAGQVRQGTSCVVPINASDVASAANSAYSSAVSVSNTNATNYTNTAIANITCPSGQVRQGNTCVVPVSATDVSNAANAAYTNAVSTSNTYASNYTNTAIANITCPAGQVRQGTSCVVPINASDVASAANSAYSSAVSVSNTNATNYTNTAIANITCPAGQVRQGSSCVVPITSADVWAVGNWAVTQAVNTVTCPAGQIMSGSSCIATPSSAPVDTTPSGTLCGSVGTGAGAPVNYTSCQGQPLAVWAGYWKTSCPSGYTYMQVFYGTPTTTLGRAATITMYSCIKN